MLLRASLAAIVFLSPGFLLGAAASRFEISDGSVIVGEILERSGDVYRLRMKSGAEVEIRGCDIVQVEGADRDSVPALSIDRPVLRFHGSNTVGEKLLPSVAEAFVLASGGGDTAWVTGGRENEKTLQVGSGRGCLPERIEVRAHGSSTAFKALEAGEAEVGMSSRPIKRQELMRLSALGDLTGPGSENVLALDGVAVIVHPGNPVGSLTREDLARIFAGEIGDWSAIGGHPGAITVYARDQNSGTYDTFDTLVLKGQGRSLLPAARRLESSEALSDGVASDPQGIGFIGLSYIRKAKPIAIRECGIAYRPSAFVVKTEEYPLARRLFLYAPAESQSGLVRDFLGFGLSGAGQEVVRKAGFVDLSIDSGGADSVSYENSRVRSAVLSMQRRDVLQDFVETTEGATRLSVGFRFRTGSARLDSRALRDVQRVAAYMQDQEGTGRQLMLLGFSDAVGEYDGNLALSRVRAKAVAKQLEWSGVRGALAKGFGEESPVACNDSAAGRETNRRVEVWVK